MSRGFWFFSMLLLSGISSAAEEKIIQRGEYRFSITPTPDFVVPQPIAEQWPASAPGLIACVCRAPGN